MKKAGLPIVFVVLLSLAGCAIGNKYSYNDVVADIHASGSKTVGVAVLDQRPYVKDGTKSPDFVGLQRAGFGIPYTVATDSEQPLAVDMTRVLVASLARKGYNAVPAAVSQADDRDAAWRKLIATKADLLILLTLNEWKSDTYMTTTLYYDVNMQMRDQDGRIVAEQKLEGSDNLGGDAWNPPSHARQAVPQAFKGKVEELLNNAEVAAALQR